MLRLRQAAAAGFKALLATRSYLVCLAIWQFLRLPYDEFKGFAGQWRAAYQPP